MPRTIKHRITYWIRFRLGRVRLFLNRRRSRIFFDFKKKKIVIGEKYEGKVKSISRFILLLSVIASFVTLKPPVSIIISLLFIVIEQALERVIYSFETRLIVPFPSFNVWKKADYVAVLFAKEGKDRPFFVGMVFKNRDYARQVWSFIEDWNYGCPDDIENNNVCISIIINKKANAYAVFVYPNYHRSTTQSAKKIFQRGSEDKEQLLVVGQMIMCKVFKLGGSMFERMFLPTYSSGEEFIFSCWAMQEQLIPMTETLAIRKNQIKIIDYSKLTTKDIEYHMTRYSIDWVNSGADKPSMMFVPDEQLDKEK
jgi:hypothetical protein